MEPARRRTYVRWFTAAPYLAFVAGAPFFAAYRLADRIPPEGDARLEAFVSGLVTAGAAIAGGLVTLVAVGLALSVETRRSARERYSGHQADLIREAGDWLRTVSTALGEIYAAAHEAGMLTSGPQRTHADYAALTRARHFRDSEQNLFVASRLAALIDDPEVVSALEKADGTLRRWNEAVSSDPCGPNEITLPDPPDDVLFTFSELADLHQLVEKALARAVRATWT